MQTALFTQMNNLGRTAIIARTAATQCSSNSEIVAMELTTLLSTEAHPYNPEMVQLLLQLKQRGPVAKFKNADAALERLLPSNG